MKRAEDRTVCGFEKTVADTVSEFSIRNNIGGIKLAYVQTLPVDVIGNKRDVPDDKKRSLQHDMSLHVRVGSIVQVAVQQTECPAYAVLPVVGEVVFGKESEIGKIFGALVNEPSCTRSILK